MPLSKCNILVSILFCYSALLMIDAYICYWLTFFIDKLIICQDTRKKCFILHYLENTLTRFLSLFFHTIF